MYTFKLGSTLPKVDFMVPADVAMVVIKLAPLADTGRVPNKARQLSQTRPLHITSASRDTAAARPGANLMCYGVSLTGGDITRATA